MGICGFGTSGPYEGPMVAILDINSPRPSSSHVPSFDRSRSAMPRPGESAWRFGLSCGLKPLRLEFEILSCKPRNLYACRPKAILRSEWWSPLEQLSICDCHGEPSYLDGQQPRSHDPRSGMSSFKASLEWSRESPEADWFDVWLLNPKR